MVGYCICFENKVLVCMCIEVVIEGILICMLQDDLMLEEVGVILFDEFYECYFSGDFGLVLVLDVQVQLCDDLCLVVMLVMLDGEWLVCFFDVSWLSSEGCSYLVVISYFLVCCDEVFELQVCCVVQQVLVEYFGDLLVFLFGQCEIVWVQVGLQELFNGDVEVLVLYGELLVE